MHRTSDDIKMVTGQLEKSAIPHVNKWVVAAAVGIGSIMSTIDMSIVNVALPHIRGSVSATLQEITWISTAYIITTVMIMPLTGFLGGLFGQKRIYLAALIVFIAGSVLCGMTHSLTSLIAFRALQGFGAGALQPSQQAILRQTFPKEEQGMAMAIFALVIMVGPAVGPTLGGWITDNYSWQWIFLINLPIGIVALMAVSRFVHEPEDIARANRERAQAQRGHLDWPGVAVMCVTVAALQYFLEEGQSRDWFASWEIRIAGIVSAVGIIAFIIRELTATAPAVDLRLFKDRTFLAGTAIGGLQFAMLMGSMFLLPVFMQEMQGMSATDAGIIQMPRSLVMMLAMPIAGKLYNRMPPAVMVGIGVVLFSIGSIQFSHLTLDTSMSDLLWPMTITGIGFTCLFVALTTASLANVSRQKLADAAGLNSFIRQLGGSAGLAIFATLLTRYTSAAYNGLMPGINASRSVVDGFLHGVNAGLYSHGVESSAAQSGTYAFLTQQVHTQAAVIAFDKSFFLQGILFLTALPLLFFLRVPKSDSKEKNNLPIISGE
jgi:MFS transporter, DHA2 family, multidrug resistance protein